VVLVHIVFFLLALGYKRIYMGDSFEYIYEALNIKGNFLFYSGNPALPVEPEYLTQRTPLYPLFLLSVYMFSINNWIVIVLQNLLSIFNIWYARKVLINMGYQTRYDWLLLLFIAAYPAQFINANTIAPDILLQTFVLFYFGCFVALWQTKQLKYALWMSLALIAGLLVKPVFYPYTVFHIFLIVGIALLQKKRWQPTVGLAALPLCAVLLYNYWNYTRTMSFHFTSNQAFNARYYFYPFISHIKGPDSANKYLQQEKKMYASIPTYKNRYDYANARGLKLLEQNYLAYIPFHLKNTMRTYIEPGKAEMDLFTGRLTYGRLYSKSPTGFWASWRNRRSEGMRDYITNNPSLPLVLIVLLFNIVRLVGLIAFLFDKRVHWTIRGFVVKFSFYFAVAAGPIGNTRYFLPISLIVIGSGVMGITYLMNRRKAVARA
jgi:hypothetical protein